MAGKIKDLIVRIMVDDSEVEKFQKAGDKALSFSSALDGAALASTAILAGVGAAAVIAGNAASEAEQAFGAVESVFAANASRIKTLASEAHTAVGLSTTDYSNLAAVLGSQLKNMGVAHDELIPKTDELITLGADLAATYGGSTSDAVAALSSLLRGERDPIEQYGVGIKQADVNARLATMGLAGLEGEAAKAAETQAVLALLTEQTADAQGTFAKEAGSAAGAQQIATATIEDAAAKIGTLLLPVMVSVSEALATFAGWASKNAGLVQGLAIGAGALASAVILTSGAYKAFMLVQGVAGVISGIRAAQSAATVATGAASAATSANTVATWANNAAWLASPVTWIIIGIIAAIGLLVAAGIWLYENWDEVTQWLGEAWQNVADWFVSVGNGIAEWWNGLWSGIGSFLTDTWNNAVNWVMSVFICYYTWLLGMGKGISSWWNGLWSGIGDFFGSIWNGLEDIVRGAWNGIVGWIEGGVNNAIGLINGILRGINNVGGAIGIHLNLIPNVRIPRLATGGITLGPQLAMVGDNPSGREAILPLDSPAARDLLGSGNNGPMKIDKSSIEELARAIAGYVRNQNRQGVVV